MSDTRILTYRDLQAWQAGMDTVVAVYRIAELLPSAERYVLSAQMRRAAISVPANVAEGHCRRSPRAYLNHLNIALGSLAELETQLDIAARLGFLARTAVDDVAPVTNRVRQLLHGLRRSIAHRHRLDDSE
jgi:four helix bundle protein